MAFPRLGHKPTQEIPLKGQLVAVAGAEGIELARIVSIPLAQAVRGRQLSQPLLKVQCLLLYAPRPQLVNQIAFAVCACGRVVGALKEKLQFRRWLFFLAL